jgi:hypothetical protein
MNMLLSKPTQRHHKKTPYKRHRKIPINPSDDNLITIATGNTFQQVIGSNGSAAERRALIIKNNNTNGDTCWAFFGEAKASKEESVILALAAPMSAIGRSCRPTRC